MGGGKLGSKPKAKPRPFQSVYRNRQGKSRTYGSFFIRVLFAQFAGTSFSPVFSFFPYDLLFLSVFIRAYPWFKFFFAYDCPTLADYWWGN